MNDIEKRTEKYKQHRKEYEKNNRDRLSNLQRERRHKAKMIVLEHYGGSPPKCECCGESEPLFLTLDHINNDGKVDRKLHGVDINLYRWIIKNNFPEDNYRVLCFNCNCGRARNGGICPHKGHGNILEYKLQQKKAVQKLLMGEKNDPRKKELEKLQEISKTARDELDRISREELNS